MSRITDTPKKMNSRLAQCVEFPSVTLTSLLDANNGVNDYFTSGATRGAVVAVVGEINTATPGVDKATFFMKGFREPEWPWYPLVADAGIGKQTPVGYVTESRYMSDTSKKMPGGSAINSKAFSVVPVAELSDRADPINQYSISGKRKYTFVIGADETDVDSANWTYVLYMATGHIDVDPWVALDGTELTPAGSAMEGQGTLRSDRQRKLYNAAVTSLGIPVVTQAEVANAAGGINVHGKVADTVVIAVDDIDAPTDYKFYMAKDWLPTDIWYNLDGATASVTPS